MTETHVGAEFVERQVVGFCACLSFRIKTITSQRNRRTGTERIRQLSKGSDIAVMGETISGTRTSWEILSMP